MSSMQTILQAASETTTEPIANASSSLTTGFADSTGLVTPALAVVIAIVVVGLLSPNIAVYADALYSVLGSSLEYALKGFATVLVFAMVFAPIYVLGQADAGTRNKLFIAVAALVGGYFGLAAIGYVADRVYSKWAARHERLTGDKPFASVRGALKNPETEVPDDD